MKPMVMDLYYTGIMKKLGRYPHLKNINNFNSIIKTILIHYWKISSISKQKLN